jgi:hypothetical protein
MKAELAIAFEEALCRFGGGNLTPDQIRALDWDEIIKRAAASEEDHRATVSRLEKARCMARGDFDFVISDWRFGTSHIYRQQFLVSRKLLAVRRDEFHDVSGERVNVFRDYELSVRLPEAPLRHERFVAEIVFCQESQHWSLRDESKNAELPTCLWGMDWHNPKKISREDFDVLSKTWRGLPASKGYVASQDGLMEWLTRARSAWEARLLSDEIREQQEAAAILAREFEESRKAAGIRSSARARAARSNHSFFETTHAIQTLTNYAKLPTN